MSRVVGNLRQARPMVMRDLLTQEQRIKAMMKMA
jgi:hypothetical protein